MGKRLASWFIGYFSVKGGVKTQAEKGNYTPPKYENNSRVDYEIGTNAENGFIRREKNGNFK